MITMEMIGKVRRMKLREQLSNSEIAKRTGLSRNTVKKWLKAPGDQAPKYKRQSGFTKLSAFEATLVQALKADSHRPKHARRSARALLAQLQAQGYRAMLAQLGVTQSMSRKGNCFDNAVIESFFGTLKAEYFHLASPDSVDELEAGVHDYVRYYNHERIKLRLKGLSPVEYRLRNTA